MFYHQSTHSYFSTLVVRLNVLQLSFWCHNIGQTSFFVLAKFSWRRSRKELLERIDYITKNVWNSKEGLTFQLFLLVFAVAKSNIYVYYGRLCQILSRNRNNQNQTVNVNMYMLICVTFHLLHGKEWMYKSKFDTFTNMKFQLANRNLICGIYFVCFSRSFL